MTTLAKTIILGAVFFIAACVPSLNPLYTEQDLMFDDSLIGVWIDKETGETWSFSKCGKMEYTLHYTAEDGRKGEFSARLVRLDDKMFLDMVPVKPGFLQNDYYQSHFIATHTFAHIAQKGTTVQVSMLEPRCLKDLLAANPAAIKHETIGGELVLSSPPKETQKFLLANLSTSGAFSPPMELTRRNSK